jgi:hypothetical protein
MRSRWRSKRTVRGCRPDSVGSLSGQKATFDTFTQVVDNQGESVCKIFTPALQWLVFTNGVL